LAPLFCKKAAAFRFRLKPITLQCPAFFRSGEIVMKLQHYIGGLEGLGPIEFDKRVFAEEWEKRIFGIHVAMMALSTHLPFAPTRSTFHNKWSWADLRTGAEGMNPFDYFKYRYYEKWLGGITGFFIAEGYITAEELAAETEAFLRNEATPATAPADPAIDARVEKYLQTGDSGKRDIAYVNRFAVGDQVRVKDVPAAAHTRLPGFLRGRVGTVETVYPGAYGYFNNTGVDGVGPAMPVYCVKFAPADLWGVMAEDGFTIYADLFDAYLAPPAAAQPPAQDARETP
jgi:nitrile hydratase subunit beta